MADFMVRFDDFSGGDMGVIDPAMAQSNTFNGENVVVYPSRLVGPRAGVKPLPVTGLPAYNNIPGPMGFTALNNTLLIVVNDRIYQFPEDGGAATPWAAYPGVPITSSVRFVNGNGNLYTLVHGDLYKHSPDGSTITHIATPMPLDDIVRWGYYFVGVEQGPKPWRIWSNNVNDAGSDFDTWDANNYVDVGNNDPIRCLKPIYNTLYAGKKEGWWAVSGVLNSPGALGLASVRDVCIGNGPLDCKFTSVTTDNRIIYWPVQNVPAFFNGATVQLETEQVVSPRNLSQFTGDAVTVTPTARRLALAADDGQGTKLLVYQNGAWVRHRSGFRLGGIAPSDVRQGSDLPMHVMYAAQRPLVIGEPVVVATLQHEMNRPAHVDDQYASPIDAGESDLIVGTLQPPAWFDGQGRQVRVRWVQIQFRKWASGVSGAMNRIGLRVEALGPYGGGSEMSEPVYWLEASGRAGRAPRDGADDSFRVNVGEQGWANGFRLHLELAGVAVREIVVGLNLRAERQ